MNGHATQRFLLRDSYSKAIERAGWKFVSTMASNKVADFAI
jgi:hypothetical protein